MKDSTLENLLELNGERFVVDEVLGYWVKFAAKRMLATPERPHGIKYSLTLHDRHNQRILGFDNAHSIEYGGKTAVAPKRIHDHRHPDESEDAKPYHYTSAAKLLEDFWKAVDKKIAEAQP